MYVTDNKETFPYPRYQNPAPAADQNTPQWAVIYAYHYNKTPPFGDDVWFNALPSYVANKPLYIWAYDPKPFIDNSARTIFTCPTATSQGVDANDNTAVSGSGFMVAGARPLFGYGMNSHSLANEQINNINAILKTPMVVHPSAFVLFSDVRNRSAELPYNGFDPANKTILATPHCYTTRFSSRHNQGGQITFGDGHAAYFKYDHVVSDGIKNPSIVAGKDPGNTDINWDANGLRVP